MSLTLQAFVFAIATWAICGIAHSQEPYRTTTGQVVTSASTVRNPVPPPHPTMQHYTGGTGTSGTSSTPSPVARNPQTSAPGYSRQAGTPAAKYTWKKNIVTTVFWVGEQPSTNNPTTNVKSSWDTEWMKNFGGYDNPDKSQRTYDFCPKGFKPKQNPFYCALPYNDVASWNQTKSEARLMIPWFRSYFRKHGLTVCKSRWIAIHCNGKTCFAQWEDVGPFRTDDWAYVFGQSEPINQSNNGAGLDVSPAVRDYLGMRSGQRCHWRFVDLHEVRHGPWKKYGDNNHFVKPQEREIEIERAKLDHLRKLRDEAVRNRR